jgi:flavodoxin/Pyruvate/2-oxoacid:ferredoxin oxidoreductase delta subunit
VPKSLIVYFSQMGSTEKVAKAIAAGLWSGGYETTFLDLKHGLAVELGQYELLGIGSPVFNYNQPFNVVDFLESLPGLNEKGTFLFNTFGTYKFDADAVLIKLATNKGAKVLGYFACRGYDSFLGYAKLGHLFSQDHPDAKDLGAAEEFGRKIAGAPTGDFILKTTVSTRSRAPIIYKIERLATNRWLSAEIYSRFFKLSETKCTGCKLCARICPTSNIDSNELGQPLWQRHCIGCLMCEMRCPHDAIRSPVADWAVFRPFLEHNIRAALKDSSIEHVRVKHLNGRIIRA